MLQPHALASRLWCSLAALALLGSTTSAQTTPPKPDFPPHATVLKDYTKVVSTVDGKPSMYTLYINAKDGQLLAELPSSFATKKYFLATTVAAGDEFAGLQVSDMYFYWRKIRNRLVLMLPNIETRSNGDPESKNSVKRLFTDRMLVEVPILTKGPGGGPVFDLDALLLGNASMFFGGQARPLAHLATIKKTKAFPQNIEIAFEAPNAARRGSGSSLQDQGYHMQTMHYSISEIPTTSKYKPRVADQRVGYFTTAFSDYGQYTDDKTRVRYITRWDLEKRDPKLKLSPPQKQLVFYIEHTTPVRYRRWVEDGILAWNKAFEKVGIYKAVHVEFQDAVSGAHMDKDPEDVRYNFVRWLNNNIGTAIGPSRINPGTGQILDADIVLTDGWIRHYHFQFNDLIPKIAMQSFNAETLSWLARHPQWDPRVRLAPPSRRESIVARIARDADMPFAGHALAKVNGRTMGDDQLDGLIHRQSQTNGQCNAASGQAFDVALMRMHFSMVNSLNAVVADDKKDDKKDEKKEDEKKPEPKESMIDGMPESFVGPLLSHLVAHEVGHTLGLRHNFKGSSIHSLSDINSEKFKGKLNLGESVMDYSPVNINFKGGKIQGDWGMHGIGAYDEWAIEYGYSLESDLKPILARVSEPQLAFATDEDTDGPDPLARRYDFTSNPLEYAQQQIRLSNYHRAHILDNFVKDGDSWAKARRGYGLTLSLQMRSLSMMANWIGGAHTFRDKKGDKGDRVPIVPVAAKTQRDALKFVVDHAFKDEAFGLTPKLLKYLTHDKWLDGNNWQDAYEDATWPVHERIMGLQASSLTMLMNPTTLRRVFDNERLVPEKEDALTLPELFETVHAAIWSELDAKMDKKSSNRQPMISSLRRNLQREHLSRLIDLTLPGTRPNAADRPISNLALQGIKQIKAKADAAAKRGGGNVDAYSKAHLSEISDQIDKALKAEYIYNIKSIPRGGSTRFVLGREEESK